MKDNETKIVDLYHFGGGHKDEQSGAEHSSATISKDDGGLNENKRRYREQITLNPF